MITSETAEDREDVKNPVLQNMGNYIPDKIHYGLLREDGYEQKPKELEVK